MPDVPPASASSGDLDPIELLAESFIARFRAGERPSIEEYAAKYPDLAEDIRQLLPALVALENDGAPTGTAVKGFQSVADSEAVELPRQLGDYLILREIGRGGMGVVYEAVQQSLGRHVALKVLPSHGLGTGSQLDRFRLEARSAARLHHSNIVPVFGVGEQDGTHYYAMQFIQGQGLDEVFEEIQKLRNPEKGTAPPDRAKSKLSTVGMPGPARSVTHALLMGEFGETPKADPEAVAETTDGRVVDDSPTATAAGASTVPRSAKSSHQSNSGQSVHSELSGSLAETRYHRSVARVGLQVAEALAYAHSEGILHRDIKPSNLLLDAKGAVWITDFGLAKSEGSDALTHTGDIVGTLRYMAPERFDGWSDPRSDVYSLGVTLYELLTLRYLFQEPNRAKLIDRVMHDTPTPLRKIDREIPRDLETIVLKAIAKEPGQRYTNAEQMAEDLRRFLADKPVLARRSSPSEKAWRWCRRNPGIAASSGIAAALLVTAVVTLAISNARIRESSKRLFVALNERGSALATAKKSAEEADRQRVRAEAGESQARSAVDEFLNKVTEDQLLKAPGMQNLRVDLLRSALKFYDGFLKERGDDPNLRSALAEVHLRVGRIQTDVGELSGARRSNLAARRLYESLVSANPANSSFRDGLATTYLRTEEFGEAIAIWESLLKTEPRNPLFRSNLSKVFHNLARQQGLANQREEQLKSYRRSLALREGLVQEFPDDTEYQSSLSMTLDE